MKETIESYHLDDLQLSLYVDALKLDRLHKVPPSILTHINQCDKCLHEAMDMYAMLGQGQQVDLGPHPTLDRPAQIVDRKRLFLRIAVAAALAAMAFFFYQRSAKEVPQQEMVQEDTLDQPAKEPTVPANPPLPAEENPEVKEKIPEEQVVEQAPQAIQPPASTTAPKKVPADDRVLFAANFVPNEHWESMVEEVTRSVEFEALQPARQSVFSPGSPIRFQWNASQAEELQLVVMNNKGDSLKTINISGSEWNWTDPLVPGRYYWKVETADDLLHVGRFEVAGSQQ